MDQHSEQAKSQLFTVKLDRDAVYQLAVQDQAQHQSQLRSTINSRPAPPARRNLTINQVIDGKYRILELIGQGGMGAVFRVFHIQLDKEVALKTFVTNALTEEAWLRFQREAQAIARLNHLNVVKVFDFGVDSDGVPYYTMELLRGRSLAQVIDEEGGFDQKRTISTFIMVARGLAAAHSRGIIHRDIKPGNILLIEDNGGRYEESVKLVDFGIATLVSDGDSHAQLGDTGAIFGSPLYMSPEQFRGGKLTPGTDLYSFGCTLFEALTTAPPFFGANAIETMNMHLNAEPPSLAAALPAMDVPQRLERLLHSLLAKDIMERPADFGVVERELLAVLERLETTAAVASKASIKRLATSAPIDDEDEIETRADLLPQSFWKRSVISTIALGSLLVLGIAGGAVVLQKPIKAVLSGGKVAKDQTHSQPVDPAVKPSRVDSSIELSSYNDVKDRVEGAIAQLDNSKKDQKLDLKDIGPIEPGSFDRSTSGERRRHERHFVFPKGVNIGKFVPGKGKSGFNDVDASGEVLLPECTWFKPNSQLADHPELLEGFKYDSIDAISTDQSCLLTDKHMQRILRWTKLGALDIDARKVTVDGLNGIEKLHRLSSLGLAYIKLPADQLGRKYDMRKLVVLNLTGVRNLSALLKDLGPDFKVKQIYAQNCALTDEDIKVIAKLPNLEQLSVRDNPAITDAGVKNLSSAVRLKGVSLSGTSVTPAVASILAGFPLLNKVIVNTRPWSEQQRQQFDSKLPDRIEQLDQ